MAMGRVVGGKEQRRSVDRRAVMDGMTCDGVECVCVSLV